jgi:hypothetical protein
MSKSASLKASLGLLKLPKPRNPFAAPAHLRHAGRHEPQPGGTRQALRLMTIRDLAGFELPPDDVEGESSGP